MRCYLDKPAAEYEACFEKIFDEMKNGMCSAPLSESISGNFISRMLPHHRAAIEMSENILKYTENDTLIKICGNIISEQTKSIENMTEIYETCREKTNMKSRVDAYGRRICTVIDNMFFEMEGAFVDNNISLDFIRQMIPHHKGAVLMSQAALKENICPALKPVLTSIITSQKKGIMEMRTLYSRLCDI